jgi:hypothetical protein
VNADVALFRVEREAAIEHAGSEHRLHLWLTEELLDRVSAVSGLEHVFADAHHAQRVFEHLLVLGIQAKEAELEADKAQLPLL